MHFCAVGVAHPGHPLAPRLVRSRSGVVRMGEHRREHGPPLDIGSDGVITVTMLTDERGAHRPAGGEFPIRVS